MLRTVIAVVLFIALCVGLWWIYKEVTDGHTAIGNGEVYKGDSNDKSLTEARPTPSRSDEPGTINTVPQSDYNKDAANANNAATAGYNSPSGGAVSNIPQQQGYAPDTSQYPQNSNSQTTQPYKDRIYNPEKPLPSTDTLPANPPNGYAYAGAGAYELYRQGNLTFRMDTKTGASCVMYATPEEWNNPLVYSHGCGSRTWRGRHHAR